MALWRRRNCEFRLWIIQWMGEVVHPSCPLVAYRLSEHDELCLAQPQRAGEPVSVQRRTEHAGKAFRRAVEIDVLADEADIGGGHPMLLLAGHAAQVLGIRHID